MIGFEVELDRRVTDMSGGKIKGDEKLATCCGGEFTVVSDSRSVATKIPGKRISYSNIELVTHPFDQMTGDVTAITKALQHMNAFTVSCYAVGKATSLQDVLKLSGLPYVLTKAGASAVVRPNTDLLGPVDGTSYKAPDLGLDSLFVHYTVGFPVLRLNEALAWVTTRVRPEAEDEATAKNPRFFPSTNARRAALAGQAAAELFGRWSKYRTLSCTTDDFAAVSGYVSLLYTQLAAAIDHSYLEKERGQIKNKAVVVCRVPLRNVAGVLPATVQRFLREQAWADMLTEGKVGKTADDLLGFVKAGSDAAAKDAKQREKSADKAMRELPDLEKAVLELNNKLAMLDERDDPSGLLAELDALKAESRKRQEIIADYTDAVAASKQWQAMLTALPEDLALINKERIDKRFQWSVIDQAIVPALEGRPLANNPMSRPVDRLFAGISVTEGTIAPDRGIARGLATETLSDMDGDPVTFGQYLYSAMLAPAQRTIGQTKIFGGMHEVATPDAFIGADKVLRHLVPLELRSHGPLKLTWTDLNTALQELAIVSTKLAS